MNNDYISDITYRTDYRINKFGITLNPVYFNVYDSSVFVPFNIFPDRYNDVEFDVEKVELEDDTYVQVESFSRDGIYLIPTNDKTDISDTKLCATISGDGIVKIEMNFLPDVYVPCEVCDGKRYNQETLDVRYKGKNINDVLEMTCDEALEFFEHLPKIKRKLQTLVDVGLGYVKLGQPATTLSGGEAQRVKLAKELSRQNTSNTLYILDEPTTGLHFEDINKLLKVLCKLRNQGNTLIVIEHNLDVIKTADYIIDLGRDGGKDGGELIACGTPEEIIKTDTYTAQYLRGMLEKSD
jgi:excinuclease UvrABC ATPase subunit